MTNYEQNPDDAWLEGHVEAKEARELRPGDRFVLYGWHFESLDWHVYEAAGYPERNEDMLFVPLKDEDNLIMSRYSSIVRILHGWVDATEFLAQYVRRRTARLTPEARQRLTEILTREAA
jgi:hypothetical protein